MRWAAQIETEVGSDVSGREDSAGGPTGKSSVENYLRRQGTHCVIPRNRVKRTGGKSFHSRAH